MTSDRHSAGPDRRLGLAAVLAGVALALAVQVAAPVGVPLYDGVVVQEPYRHLHPSGDQVGSPTSFESSPVVEGEVSPGFVAATTENPAQAQLIAQEGAFQLTQDATSLHVTIAPVEPPSVAPEGTIVGNVYRISVTDQAGTPLATRPCEGCRNLVMRAPEGTELAHIALFAGGQWVSLETVHAGIVGMYAARRELEALGDFAVVADPGGSGGDQGLTLERIVLFGGAAVILVLVVAAALVFRRRPSAAAVAGRGRATPSGPSGARARGIPSKRRASRKPPPGPSPRPPSGRADQ